MRLLLAMLKHETNTFSPVPTPTGAFGAHGPLFGAAALAGMRGTRTPMGAFIDLAEAAGATIVTPLAADALPGGVVEAEAYERLTGAILASIEGCDAALLDLHGAMVAAPTDDGEGTLLQRIRARRHDLPIGVALDLHANMTPALAGGADAIVGYKTYPHVDMYEAGAAVGRILLDRLAGRARPVIAWRRVPVVAATLCMGTTGPGPMTEMIELARAAERRPGILAASVFGGFPMADIAEPGMSVVVVADGDPAAAAAVADELAAAAWQRRERFVYRAEPLAASVARAKALAEDAAGPVLLIDHADNCASGGTQDTMAVIAEVLRQGLEDVAVASIRDPEAVARLAAAGVGARLRLPVGGKTDLPALGRRGEPLELEGKVRAITDGEFVVTGPMLTGVTANMGRSVLLDTGTVELVITELAYEPWDLGVFRSLGVEPARKRFLVLKSRMHYRAVFAPLAAAIVECDGVGVTGSDLGRFRFAKLHRPVYPFDPAMAWPAAAQ